jgi:hypothetical protein
LSDVSRLDHAVLVTDVRRRVRSLLLVASTTLLAALAGGASYRPF